MSDKWLFGFITLWIVLTAGKPDLLDTISKRVSGTCDYQQNLKEIVR